MWRGVWLVIAAALLLAPSLAEAHARSVAYVDWHLDEAGASAQIRLLPLDHEALRASGVVAPSDYLTANVRLRRAGVVCAARDGRRVDAGDMRVAYAWRVDCEAVEGEYVVESDAGFDAVAGHVQLVTVWLPGDAEPVERVLSERARSARVGEPGESGGLGTAVAFAREGVAHIASGWDHLIFLLVLVVGLGRLRDVALAVTGFTLGHSVTLALAALGWARPDAGAVEVLIAASIVVLAVENVWLAQTRPRAWGLPLGLVAVLAASGGLALGTSGVGLALLGLALFAAGYFALLGRLAEPQRLRLGIAALFGLVHGFGFAGALVEMGLPAGQRVVALLSFNVGVEAGQLGLVAVAAVVLYLVRGRAKTATMALGSAAAAGAGAFWFVARLWAG